MPMFWVTESFSPRFSCTYPSLAVSDAHLPCFLNSLSLISAVAAAVVPPARNEWRPNLDLSSPKDCNAFKNSSLALVHDKSQFPLKLYDWELLRKVKDLKINSSAILMLALHRYLSNSFTGQVIVFVLDKSTDEPSRFWSVLLQYTTKHE